MNAQEFWKIVFRELKKPPAGHAFCHNMNCQRPLTDRDPVVMITSAHIRWFCCVECIGEGNAAHIRAIVDEAMASR
jgi:hypothetical protein